MCIITLIRIISPDNVKCKGGKSHKFTLKEKPNHIYSPHKYRNLELGSFKLKSVSNHLKPINTLANTLQHPGIMAAGFGQVSTAHIFSTKCTNPNFCYCPSSSLLCNIKKCVFKMLDLLHNTLTSLISKMFYKDTSLHVHKVSVSYNNHQTALACSRGILPGCTVKIWTCVWSYSVFRLYSHQFNSALRVSSYTYTKRERAFMRATM